MPQSFVVQHSLRKFFTQRVFFNILSWGLKWSVIICVCSKIFFPWRDFCSSNEVVWQRVWALLRLKTNSKPHLLSLWAAALSDGLQNPSCTSWKLNIMSFFSLSLGKIIRLGFLILLGLEFGLSMVFCYILCLIASVATAVDFNYMVYSLRFNRDFRSWLLRVSSMLFSSSESKICAFSCPELLLRSWYKGIYCMSFCSPQSNLLTKILYDWSFIIGKIGRLTLLWVILRHSKVIGGNFYSVLVVIHRK